MERREFLKSSAKAGALAGLGLGGVVVDRSAGASAAPPAPDEGLAGPIGRPVSVVSIGFNPGNDGKPLEQIAGVVDREAARGADIIALPETCRGFAGETLDGPTVTAMGALARKHQTYIACAIQRLDGNQKFNSVVLLDRKGQAACVYNKIYPWIPEFEISPTLAPGGEVTVYQADFGRVGFAICFDIDFPEVWQRLADQGAELVIWPSAYSGGRVLQAHAVNHHYYVVSCTGHPDCVVYDIDGTELLYQKNIPTNVSRITLDLDRGIYCSDAPVDPTRCALVPPSSDKRRDKLLKEHPDDVMMEKYLEREDWFVLKAKRPGVSARALARSYGLEEKRHQPAHCRMLIDKRRGWVFAAKVAERSEPS